MTESEILRLIKKTIREELASILMGTIVSNQNNNRSSVTRFSTEGPIGNLRNIQPYGMSSRAPSGTSALIVPIASDPTHLNVVGHFDESRPSTSDGETILYDAYGHVIYLSETKIQIGSKTSSQNLVLGQIFKTLMNNLLTALQAETHVGNLGYPTSVPQNSATYASLQASPVDDEAVLSQKSFTE